MQDFENINIEMKDLPPVGGVLSPGRHAGEVSEGDLGIETALAMQISDLQKELELSKASATRWEENYYSERNKVNTLEQVLPKMVSDELITNTGAKEIADIFGLEITKSVNVSGTITFSGQIEISIFDDVDDLSRYELDADVNVSYGYDSLSSFDYDLDSVEFEED
jgi:hypothetical protein